MAVDFDLADNCGRILVVWKNRTTCELHSDRVTLQEVQTAFSYFAKDYKFNPLYKRGLWDGRTYLFKVSGCLFPTGLLSRFRDWCATRGVEVEEIPGEHGVTHPFDVDFFLEHVAKSTDFEIMQHQLGSVEEVLVNNRRLILSPTSSGKSLIQYLVARYINKKHGKRVLIIVPNKTLVVQMREDFGEYANDGWGKEDTVHIVYAEQEIWTNHDVVVSTYQTAVKQPPEWFEGFGAVMIDEAHGATSKSVSTILGYSTHMLYHAGFTGTLNGTHMHEMEMRARFGDVTKLVTTRELMDMGIVAQLTIHALSIKHSGEEVKAAPKWRYPDEIAAITKIAARNDFLVGLATSSDKNVMILFHHTAHGKELQSLIEAKIAGTGKKLFYVDGNVEIKDRVPVRAHMEANDGCILLASFGTSSVGLSIKNIHCLILGHPFKDRIRVLQTIGRGLRISPTKKEILVVDVGDDFSGTRKTKNATYDHFVSRLELYQEEGFDYTVVSIEGVM